MCDDDITCGDVMCDDVTRWWQHWSVSQQGELYNYVCQESFNGIQWISCTILHVVLLLNIFCNKTIKSV